MKYTADKPHTMTARFRSWEPEERQGGVYRGYSDPRDIACTIQVTFNGSMVLTCDEELQTFGIIDKMTDAGGTVFMNTTWYQINRVFPEFDAKGFITGYRHQLAILAPEVIGLPIDPPRSYPVLDQG